MPPSTVKPIQSVPFKGLSDSKAIQFVGDVKSPDLLYVLAYPTTEVKRNIHESVAIPEVATASYDVKDVCILRKYGAGVGKTLILPGSPTRVLVGAGKLKDGKVCSRTVSKKIAVSLASHIREQRPGKVVFDLPEFCDKCFPYFIGYFRYALYAEDRFRMERSKLSPIEMTISLPAQADRLAGLLAVSEQLAETLVFMKELSDAPPNYCHPTGVKDVAVSIAKESGMTYKVFDFQACLDMGMGGFCAVAQGMTNEPYFVHMVYRNGTPKRRMALVGKGVCMDTGGYAIKPTVSMLDMHHDMGGAATTLSVAKLIGQTKPQDVEMHFIIPLVENLVDAQAYLNGDVITTMSGLNVLVRNTDAEGRMILCDGITYALQKFDELKTAGKEAQIPHTIMTIATLTGAAVVALGTQMAPFYSTCDALAEKVKECSDQNVDKVWRFPFSDEHYNFLNEDDRADLPNISKLGAGSVIAAHFLKEFVLDENVDFMHFDIAGPMSPPAKKGQCDAYGPFLMRDIMMKISNE